MVHVEGSAKPWWNYSGGLSSLRVASGGVLESESFLWSYTRPLYRRLGPLPTNSRTGKGYHMTTNRKDGCTTMEQSMGSVHGRDHLQLGR